MTSFPQPTRNKATNKGKKPQETKHDFYIIRLRDEFIHQVLMEGVRETRIESNRAHPHTDKFSKINQ